MAFPAATDESQAAQIQEDGSDDAIFTEIL